MKDRGEAMSTRMTETSQRDRVAGPPRLPEQTHVGAVRLQISDLERSVEYYQGVLGMDVLERGAGRASLGVKGATPLAYFVEKSGVAPVPRRGRFGLYHFALLLPDRVALGSFAAHVLRLGTAPWHGRPRRERSAVPDRPRRAWHRGLCRPDPCLLDVPRRRTCDDHRTSRHRRSDRFGRRQRLERSPGRYSHGPCAPSCGRSGESRGVLSPRAALRKDGVELSG